METVNFWHKEYAPPPDPKKIAERYWLDMRREMFLAIEREQKAFSDYQDACNVKVPSRI
jgi:hypothetical protein